MATLTALKDAIPDWLRLVSDEEDLKPRLYGALAYLDPKNPELLAALVQSLESKNMATVRGSLRIIGAMNPLPHSRKVVPALVHLLEVDRFALREMDPWHSTIVEVREEDHFIQCTDALHASIALLCNYRVDAKEAVPILLKLLPKYGHDKSYDLRVLFPIALGRIGPEAKEALPALREMQKALETTSRPGPGLYSAYAADQVRKAIRLIEGGKRD